MAIAALSILGYLIFLLSGSHGFFRSKSEIFTYVGDSFDLAEGAPVRLNGIDIGKVKRLTLSGSNIPQRVVKIDMEVYDEYLSAIPVDSTVKVAQSTLLSPRYMNITKGQSKDAIQTGAELKSGITTGMEDLFAQGDTTLAALQQTVDKINKLADEILSGQGSIGKLLTDPSLFNNANEVVNETRKLVAALNTNKGTLGTLINDDKLTKQFEGTMDRVNQMLDDLQQGQGTAGKFLKDPALYNNLQAGITDLRKSVDQFNQLLADLNAGKGSAGKILKSDDLANQIHETIARLDTTLDKINSGEGTIGQLLNNPSLFDSLNGTTTELHGLLKDFRANPKKFLSIKLHIF